MKEAHETRIKQQQQGASSCSHQQMNNGMNGCRAKQDEWAGGHTSALRMNADPNISMRNNAKKQTAPRRCGAQLISITCMRAWMRTPILDFPEALLQEKTRHQRVLRIILSFCSSV